MSLSLEERASLCQNKLAKKVFNLMIEKKSNLCLSCDLTKSNEILAMAERVGPHIIILKLHSDAIEDFNYEEFIPKLIEVSKKNKFLLFEDRKFADIGETVVHQYRNGFSKILNWAHIVTVHSICGEKCIESLKEAAERNEDRGCVLVAQLSCQGNLINANYTEKSVTICNNNRDFCIGFISQSKLSSDPTIIHMTPGINFAGVTGDNRGQQYVTAKQAVTERGADIVIVGRAIIKATDPVAAAISIKKEAFVW